VTCTNCFLKGDTVQQPTFACLCSVCSTVRCVMLMYCYMRVLAVCICVCVLCCAFCVSRCGDVVMELRDGSKLELRSLPDFDNNYNYILSRTT
jgi:hypothetical protein